MHPLSRPLRPLALAATLAILAAGPLRAQQFGTDDAGVAELGTCQVEAWTGAGETRVEPACRLVPALEVMIGAEFETRGRGGIEVYGVELKTPLRAVRPGGIGLALVAGVDITGPATESSGEVAEVFAFVPATLTLGDGRLQVHGNLGWQWEPEQGDTEPARHALTWGARSDLELPRTDERLVLVGELFGADGGAPEFQAGVRAWVVPDRLILDVSYGGHSRDRSTGRGWIVGVGWTP